MAPKKFKHPNALSRVFVEELRLERVQGEYRLHLRTSEGYEAEMRHDDRLGCMMSAWSGCLKGLAAQQGKAAPTETRLLTGNIIVSYYNIRPLDVWPYAWHLTMHGHGFKYEANVDGDLEHIILAYQGAMKFFSYKLGLTVLYDEVIRNAEAAGEMGLVKGGTI